MESFQRNNILNIKTYRYNIGDELEITGIKKTMGQGKCEEENLRMENKIQRCEHSKLIKYTGIF